MDELSRDAAVDRLEAIVETVEREPMPVPVRELWAFGDVALGVDPVERLDVYLTKDLLMRDDPDADAVEAEFEERLGVSGIGKSVRAAWAEEFPEHVRANDQGHAAPERCLAAQLLEEDEPVHLEVCNTGFEDNVTQRLRGARARGEYATLLDPRGVCLWIDGVHSEEAFAKLRDGSLALPKLSGALQMLGMDEEEAVTAARELQAWRADQEGATVRGDVV